MTIAVVIPCYCVKQHIVPLLESIGPEIDKIYVVDDACPEQSGSFVRDHFVDPRLKILVLEHNQGVGGATLAGYRAALEDGADIIVKLDGDGQMDPALIRKLILPIQRGFSDYAKGNRFFSPEQLEGMPWVRLAGNSFLSLMSKVMSGYYTIMDPTNGYTAVHGSILKLLPLNKIDRRYFFESDMLFRLGALRAVVMDVPMPSSYRDETSHLQIPKIIAEFSWKYVHRGSKRLLYNYFIRDFNVGTVQLVLGLVFLAFGGSFGLVHWIGSYRVGAITPAGTVMLAAIPVILGFQLLLSWIQFDVASTPRTPVHPMIQERAASRSQSFDSGTRLVRK